MKVIQKPVYKRTERNAKDYFIGLLTRALVATMPIGDLGKGTSPYPTNTNTFLTV